MGPTCVLSAPDGPHAGPMNLAITDVIIFRHWDDPENWNPSFGKTQTCLSTSQWRHNGCDSISNHQLTNVNSTVYLDTDQRKHQSSASLAHSPYKWPVTRKMFPFDDVIMHRNQYHGSSTHGVRASAATVLASLSRNIPASAPKSLKPLTCGDRVISV